METERFNGNGSGIVDETESRPLSQTSSELDSLGPLQVKHRDKPKLQVHTVQENFVVIQCKNFWKNYCRQLDWKRMVSFSYNMQTSFSLFANQLNTLIKPNFNYDYYRVLRVYFIISMQFCII